jgi:predicted outer membrane repeat protein
MLNVGLNRGLNGRGHVPCGDCIVRDEKELRLHRNRSWLAMAIMLGGAFAMTRDAVAEVRNVPADHATIQACIDESTDGDECVVAAGTYNEVIDFIGKAITVRSTNPTNPAVVDTTIIDGTGLYSSVVTCVSGEGLDTVLSGLTITGGTGSPCPDDAESSCGGGMSNLGSSPSVLSCSFRDNRADFGGGMFNHESSLSVIDCTFEANTGSRGGGIQNNYGTPSITSSSFHGNFGHGGGMGNFESAGTISYCSFTENRQWSISGVGGGMANIASNVIVTDCVFEDNYHYWGGGMANHSSSPTVQRCTFSRNRASRDSGGGMFNVGGRPRIEDCLFEENFGQRGGGAMHNNSGSRPIITRCIFMRNGTSTYRNGGGIQNSTGFPTVRESLFLGNTAARGGAVSNTNRSGPSFASCSFIGNEARSRGGALYSVISSTSIITNCTFVANAATNGAAIETFQSVPSTIVLANCILRNGPFEIFNRDNSDITVSNTNIEGGVQSPTVDGGGNIDADPMFVRNPDDGGDGWGDDPLTLDIDESANDDFGDLRLRVGSPAINAGDATLLPADTLDLDNDGDVTEPTPLDLDGHARVLCGEVDMGAYEFGIGDQDCNDVVNQLDFAGFEACMTGPGGGPYAGGCEPFDFNGDNDVDAGDYAMFASVFDGP